PDARANSASLFPEGSFHMVFRDAVASRSRLIPAAGTDAVCRRAGCFGVVGFSPRVFFRWNGVLCLVPPPPAVRAEWLGGPDTSPANRAGASASGPAANLMEAKPDRSDIVPRSAPN